MVQVNNREQMMSAYRQATGAGLGVVIQELIPGDDSDVVNYNSYFWDGKPLVEFTAQQIRKAPPEFGAPCAVLSKEIPEIIEPGRNILKAIGFYGYSCIELKRDNRDGIYKLMEVNGRHNRSTLLAVRCGINFPWLQYQHLVNGVLPVQQQYKPGIYWISLDRDLGSTIGYCKKKKFHTKYFLTPYIRSHVFDCLDWKDMRPFLHRCMNLLQRGLGIVFHWKKEKE
jgi:predicted ATP-grasp superfamily ATP-dependent carboligase